MKDFMNYTNPQILYLDMDPDKLIELIPPPELHLLIGAILVLGNILLDTWPGFDDLLKSKSVLQQGYQERDLDGNKILENLGSQKFKKHLQV